MANVVKYKPTTDIGLQGAIEMTALTASNVPNATSGKKTLFLDVADTTLKTKDSSGNVAAIGGTGGNSAPVAVTSGTRNVVAADNGKLFTNAGATGNIILSLDSVANLGNAFEVGVVNERNANSGIDNYTALMLHMDDTGLSDSSYYNHVITKNGGVARSATKSKFGGYSAYFDGDGDYLSTGTSAMLNLSTGDSFVSMWVYPTAWSDNASFIASNNETWSTGAATLNIDGSGVLKLGVYDANSLGAIATAPALTLNQWNYIAFCRKSNVVTLYTNGTAGTPYSISSGVAINFNTNSNTNIGRNNWDGATSYFTGYIDEVIVKKGVSVTDFTPPTSAYYDGSIIITPNASNQLPGTAAAGNSIRSSVKGDYIKLRSTDSGLICTGVYPAAGNWVDLLD